MRIRPDAAAVMLRQKLELKRQTHIPDMLRPAVPLSGVLPKGVEKAMAMDATPLHGMAMDIAVEQFVNAYSIAGWGSGIAWLGYPVLAEMAQRPEYRQMVETTAKEMTRRWIKLESIDSEPAPERAERINRIEELLKEHSVRDKFTRLAELDGFFGKGHLYIDFGTRDDPEELKTRLVLSKAKIGKKSLQYMKVVEPIWTYPGQYNSTDPLAIDYYVPRSWYVMGKELHASRLLTFISREVPDLLKPAYAFGGLSLSQMAKPYVDNWLRTRQSVSDLLHSFTIPVLSTNMQSTLSDESDDASSLATRAVLFTTTRDNQGLMMLDKDSEEFSFVSAPLGSLDKLQAQSQEHMAAVSHIPLVILLGITPAGLNVTSADEIRVYYAWIKSLQEDIFAEPLDTIIKIIQLSEFGNIDPGIGFSFVPLWEPSDIDKANVRKLRADTDAVYVGMNAIGPEEVRARIADDPDEPYSDIDPDVMPEPTPEELAAEQLAGNTSPPGGPGALPPAIPPVASPNPPGGEVKPPPALV